MFIILVRGAIELSVFMDYANIPNIHTFTPTAPSIYPIVPPTESNRSWNIAYSHPQVPTLPPVQLIPKTMPPQIQEQQQQQLHQINPIQGGVPEANASAAAENARPDPTRFVVIHNGPLPFGHAPQKQNCPHCFERTQTYLKYRSTFRTHIMAMIFCFTGLWCLVPFPYCMNSCRRLDHYCSNCKQLVGKTQS